MEYIQASKENAEQITKLVKDTIVTVYPKYYPKEVVDFFCELHGRDNILKDIEAGSVGVLLNEDVIVGTGSCVDNHVARVYVAPLFQGRGYGSYIMQCLENTIGLNYDEVYLDASLPASHLYETRGYTTIKHEKLTVKNDVVLVYEVMKKSI